MGRDFVATSSNSSNIGTKKRTVGRKVFIGPKAARFIAIIIFGALGLLYLTQSTQGADRSYKLRDLSSQKTALTEQRDRLQVESSRLESLNEIDKSINPTAASVGQMQPSSQVNYIPSDNTIK
ncbi:MAG: hypothetical protein WCG99_00075 [Candidatus Berkelbacteria bacterium]